MSNTPHLFVNPLDAAMMELRRIADDHDLLRSNMDAGSLRRIVTHLANISAAVLSSTQDHGNAAKRLNDFALSLDRLGKHASPEENGLAERLTQVATTLRRASAELAGSKAVPNWAALDPVAAR